MTPATVVKAPTIGGAPPFLALLPIAAGLFQPLVSKRSLDCTWAGPMMGLCTVPVGAARLCAGVRVLVTSRPSPRPCSTPQAGWCTGICRSTTFCGARALCTSSMCRRAWSTTTRTHWTCCGWIAEISRLSSGLLGCPQRGHVLSAHTRVCVCVRAFVLIGLTRCSEIVPFGPCPAVRLIIHTA